MGKAVVLVDVELVDVVLVDVVEVLVEVLVEVVDVEVLVVDVLVDVLISSSLNRCRQASSCLLKYSNPTIKRMGY